MFLERVQLWLPLLLLVTVDKEIDAAVVAVVTGGFASNVLIADLNFLTASEEYHRAYYRPDSWFCFAIFLLLYVLSL